MDQNEAQQYVCPTVDEALRTARNLLWSAERALVDHRSDLALDYEDPAAVEMRQFSKEIGQQTEALDRLTSRHPKGTKEVAVTSIPPGGVREFSRCVLLNSWYNAESGSYVFALPQCRMTVPKSK